MNFTMKTVLLSYTNIKTIQKRKPIVRLPLLYSLGYFTVTLIFLETPFCAYA